MAHKVLARRHHALGQVIALQAANVGHAKVADERGVFAKSFFHAPPAQVARNIQYRGQAVMCADCAYLLANGSRHGFGQRWLKGACHTDHLRIGRAAQPDQPRAAFFMDNGGDAEAGFLDEEALQAVGRACCGERIEGRSARKTGNLADAVFEVARHFLQIQLVVCLQLKHPVRTYLR